MRTTWSISSSNSQSFSGFNSNTLFECPSESTPELWPVKPLPSEKDLNFPPPRSILHNLVHPEENVK